jgi:hypothetical protein
MSPMPSVSCRSRARSLSRVLSLSRSLLAYLVDRRSLARHPMPCRGGCREQHMVIGVLMLPPGAGHAQGKDEGKTPQMHAAAIKKRLAQSDVADKAEFRRRQKENKLQLKIKLKKMMKKDSDDDEDEGPARLGGASYLARQ